MTSAICAVAKNENDYLTEWIDYHFALGFNLIILYDNSDPGDDTTCKLLEKYTSQGILKIIDYRGRHNFQLQAYNECYSSGCADWIAFIDIDEFITFSDNAAEPINSFLEKATIEHIDAIEINWMTFGDNELIRQSPENVTERFKNPLPEQRFINRHVKTIARTGKNLSFKYNPHIMDGKNVTFTDDCFNKIDGNSPFKLPSYKKLYIRHYFTKTIEEFIKCKINRGAADSIKNAKAYKLPLFYSENTRTREKRRIERTLLPLKYVIEMDLIMIQNKIKSYLVKLHIKHTSNKI